jgi:D-alanyl-D-alanine carboxypeptidase
VYGKRHTFRQHRAAFNGGVTYRQPAGTTTRRIRIRRFRAAGLLFAIAAFAAAVGGLWPAFSSSTASSPSTIAPPVHAPRIESPEASVANLDPALRGALRRAAADAADDGIELVVTSGWRSPEHQERLLHEAISKYGSEEEAARWVATPDRSAHVSGDAVDIGPTGAAAWLSENGAEYGLCRVYGNEPWHYELRPEAIAHGCPPPYADPTEDPRMQP